VVAGHNHYLHKADKAKELIGKIFNLEFLLSLSGLSDIYEQFGVIVQMTQMVHLLTHERMYLYNKSVDNLMSMALSEDHKNCAQCSEKDAQRKCLWPLYHVDKLSVKETGTVRDLPIQNKHGVRAGGLVKAGGNTEKKFEEKLLSVVKDLAVGLAKKVYSPEVIAIIEETRVVMDLRP
jgi:hypothetical protein